MVQVSRISTQTLGEPDPDDWKSCCYETLAATLKEARKQSLSLMLNRSIHLAVTAEPYLEWILQRRKTIESRFSLYRIPPYGAVRSGDWIALKRASGPIVGLCRVKNVEFHELNNPTSLSIRTRYADKLCAQDDSFWLERARARYVTLIHLGDVYRIAPVWCGKRDRRGWVVLSKLVNKVDL
jgi:hypothetical protein